jgi:hypothetical protein
VEVKPPPDNAGVTGRMLVGALAFGATLATVGAARADIDPPAGYEWLRASRTTITNARAFPDYVFVAWPCPQSYLVEEYCVVDPDQSTEVRGTLFALSTRDATVGPKKEWDADMTRAWEAAPRVLIRPAFQNERTFFEKDPRVVRPGFVLQSRWTDMLVRNTGVRAAEFFVEISKVGPAGVDARFVRAKYTCKNGGEVDLAWGPSQDEAPIPICPVLDDQGQLIQFVDGGKASPGATSALPASWSEKSLLPLGREQLIWGGVLSTSLSLLGAGLLLRRNNR